jgi:DNA-binding transcriptional MerR regulator
MGFAPLYPSYKIFLLITDFMFVSELAQRAQVSPHIVRYYTHIGLLKPSNRAHNGYRIFTEPDVKRLKFIRKAKALGFTLNEIAKILDKANHGETPCPLVREAFERHLQENRRKLEELMTFQEKMEEILLKWKQMPNSFPNGDSVCHLIESIEI